MQRSGAEPAPRLVLDTTAYSHLRRGHSQVVDLIAQADVIIVPVTVLGELEGAFHAGSRTSENRRVLSGFLAEPTVTTALTTTSVARRYGRRLRRQLKTAKTASSKPGRLRRRVQTLTAVDKRHRTPLVLN